jgi:hypothetical protein
MLHSLNAALCFAVREADAKAFNGLSLEVSRGFGVLLSGRVRVAEGLSIGLLAAVEPVCRAGWAGFRIPWVVGAGCSG